MSRVWDRLMSGVTAFKLAFLASDEEHQDEFESLEARRLRYILYWSLYENTVYSKVHGWSTRFKHTLALGKHIRGLYNPSARLASFYASHLLGGDLDSEAGLDGAVPIETENEALRPAISALWKASSFATLKDVISLRGTVEGDVILRVADDVEKQKVYLERIDVSTIAELTKDPWGNVKGYVVECQRQDPESSSEQPVTYRLDVTRNGEDVVYEQFKEDSPYAWDGKLARWTEPYTFVPLVHIMHRNEGLAWGWSELHPMLPKVLEVDDLATMLGNQIRRYVNATYLAAGIKDPGTLTVTGATAVETGGKDTRHEPEMEELSAIYGAPANAEFKPIVADLSLSDSLTHIDNLLEEIERDYPELQTDIWAAGENISGRALRVARQRVEAKVLARREGYDAGLAKLQMMAVSIGGMRGYPGYEGFSLESYDAGALEHRIAARPVFKPDPLDDIEIKTAFWQAAGAATAAGLSLIGFLRSEGWTDEQIAEAGVTEGGVDAGNEV